RISFDVDPDGRPVQRVHRDCRLPWQQHDLAGLEPCERDAQAASLEAADRRQRFALDRAPLMRATVLRLAPTRHRVLLTQHHLLGDGWSATIFFRDLLALYRARGDGTALPPPARFRDYLAWLERQDKTAA